jgi:RsiW-degrading membrane proteinase PrsW (M82 family)
MLPLAIALAFIPTIVWCLIFVWVRPPGFSLRWLLGGMIVGVVLGGPVWLAESAVDVLAIPGDRYWRGFVQQVIGAACSEESLKFIGVGLLVWLAQRRSERAPRAVVAIAISVGIGFMTLENLVAVIVSDTPMSHAIDRQMTIIAGHGSYQAIMGVFLAMSIQHRRLGWAIAALIVPLFLHGWGNLAEQLFIDEPDHRSFQDTMLYNTWIGSIVTTALAAFSLLWWVRRPISDEALEESRSSS